MSDFTQTLAQDLSSCALVIIDMQNDFIHPHGAYARGNTGSDQIRALPQRLKKVADQLRSQGGWIISTQFTLLKDQQGQPMISPHLKAIRPFLREGDFEQGKWGHELIEELQPAHLSVPKVAYSAFHQTYLEFFLKKAQIDTLIFCGIVTNGGVASTLRNAHVLGFKTLLLSDGCGAFSEEAHQSTVGSLRTISKVMTCEELCSLLKESV